MDNYVFTEQIGSRIFHRYIDRDGKHRSEVIKQFPIVLYVRGKKTATSSVGLMGETLNPIEFSDISDARDFVRENRKAQEVYGQTNLMYQFINHRYQHDIEFDFNEIRILAIDIETAYDNTGFPTPEKANQEILSISCKLFGEKNPFVVFGVKEYTRDDCTYIHCQDEFDLLTMFQRYWIQTDPDVVTGWNVQGFDIPYIVNRCNKVKGEDFTNKFSPFSQNYSKCVSTHSMGDKGSSYKILGITVIDYLDLYKKYSTTTLESYRLEVVAQHELGTGKVNYDEYDGLMGLYRDNFELFIQYNKMDVDLIEQMESKLNYLFLAFTVAYLGKMCFDDIYSQVRFWDNHIYNHLQKRGIQIPPNRDRDDSDIVGAYVKDPKPALYHWVVTLDLTSLYPSIIMSFNLSPETHVGGATLTIDNIDKLINKEMELGWLKDKDIAMLANGATFSREKLGIFPELVKDMFGNRKAFKKHAIGVSQKIEAAKERKASAEELKALRSEEATFDARQQALKIALNSLYGASANQYFRYNNRDIAEGITLTGQLIIRYISNQINEFLNETFKTKKIDYVIFNDTDSAGLNLRILVDNLFKDQSDTQKIVNFLDKFVNTHLNPFIDKKYAELVEYLNAYENMISMKREVIADRGLWRGKKNYILQVWDKEGIRYQNSKLKMMGIETAKSSTPKIVRGSLEKALRLILNKTEAEVQSYVKQFHRQFMDASLDQIAFPRGVSDLDKWIDDSGNPIKGTPIHVKGSILYNKLLKKHQIESTHASIKNGDKIKFAYLKKQNPTRFNVISFHDQLPKEFDLDQYIDREMQYEKTFLDPLKSFTDIVGWSTEEVFTLDQFFS